MPPKELTILLLMICSTKGFSLSCYISPHSHINVYQLFLIPLHSWQTWNRQTVSSHTTNRYFVQNTAKMYQHTSYKKPFSLGRPQ